MKIKFLFVLAILIQFSAWSQFVPLPLETGIWKGQQSYNFGQTTTGLWQVQSSGDSLIDGVIYQKFFPKQQWFGQPNNQISSGLIRQETDGSKVYYRPLYENQDYLLFDFTMEVGDTLEGYYVFSSGFSDLMVTVSQVDSVLINGEYRKRIIIPYGNEETIFLEWIEGIGSKHGMVFPEIAMFESHAELECMHASLNNVIYPWLGYDCVANVGVQEHEINFGMSVNYSAENQSLTIFSPNENAIVSSRIFSLDGSLILHQDVPTNQEINVELPNGLFYLVVENLQGQQLVTQKISSFSH